MVDAIRKRTTRKITSSNLHRRRLEDRRWIGASFWLVGRSPAFSIFIFKIGDAGEKKHGARLSCYHPGRSVLAGGRGRILGVWSETPRDANLRNITATNTSTLHLPFSPSQPIVHKYGDNISKHHDTQYRTVSPHTCSRPAAESRPDIEPKRHSPARRVNAACTYCNTSAAYSSCV